ncbi:MAG: glycosyltransferase N-terminal domain-containing protein [Henriciella sp.]|nr:glycosyltransferase N-terminal domain-containing protein [Henriciella sp.]
MRLGLFLYRFATRLISPFAGLVFRRRATQGKEDPKRIHERLARKLQTRPDGTLLWLHAASVGESLLQLELARRLLQDGAMTNLLFTCQTQTAASRIQSELGRDPIFDSVTTVQQMAPLDTPAIARRFITHWAPSAAIFAEGDIWPNLLTELDRRDVPAILINARMTEKTLREWSRWETTSENVFGLFSLILAGDKKTAAGLSSLSKKHVPSIGSLKSALPPPSADPGELEDLSDQIGEREIWVAASTHQGEEALVLDALMQMEQRPFLIVAPRHPERGDAVEGILTCSSLNVCRRSQVETLPSDTDILLADTMGEMGLWYRLATSVYLGGGHTPGVGGHNLLEPLRLGKPVITGPGLFNFEDLANELIQREAIMIAEDAESLVAAYPGTPPSVDILNQLETGQFGAMQRTLTDIRTLFAQKGIDL